ncbi:MinD/ParA family ATP-binding protein [Actinomyces howellii]|nr:AAA family ATPase [Actinomyces howellii]
MHSGAGFGAPPSFEPYQGEPQERFASAQPPEYQAPAASRSSGPADPVSIVPPSFLASNSASGPRPTGWRAHAARLGLRVGATDAERQQWIDERAVAQHWPGPRTIAVLNGKGGAGKTPTSILLAGYFARLGSGSVVAADGNVTRGTLGWRTEQGPHNATILDLVPEIDRLMDPAARNGDVAAFTHHQTVDQFDVLRSNPLLLSTEQKLTPAQLDGVQQVLTRYYRMIIWDTGNDEGDELWLRIVSHADQIVIATTTRADHAEAGRLLLEGLAARDERSAALVRNAVVVVSQADKEEARAQSLADGFTATAREVVTIPYDAAMREQWLRSDKLAAPTRVAWLHAAAAVARGL